LVYSYLVFKVQTSIREIALSKLNQTTEYVDQLTTESGSLTIPLSLNVDVQTFSLLYIELKRLSTSRLPSPSYDKSTITHFFLLVVLYLLMLAFSSSGL